MKKRKLICLFLVVILSLFTFSGCARAFSLNAYVISIEKTETKGLVDTYTITYSNGEVTTIEISNGADGVDGADGENVNIDELFAKYRELYPDATYEDFLKNVLTVNDNGNVKAINKALKSCAKVYAEFTENYRINYIQTTKETAIYSGSAVIYKIDDNWTYFLTNYHVLYNVSATEKDKMAKKIICYLYGSESEPVATSVKDASGCTEYDYGDYAISCEYVGGSITSDIAIIRAETSSVNKINPDATAVTFANGYRVGETAIAIGNPEGEGISVTEGIISVDNENITLSIDGTSRYYRSIRIDTPIYSGSSGGGLFNVDGKLIGVTNAGDVEDQNVNYAIPVEIVRSAVENIMYYAKSGSTCAKKITLGITVETANSKYVYDDVEGYGKIVEDVIVSSVKSGSIANILNILQGDKIVGIKINEEEYFINRYFEISDILFKIRCEDVISIIYERDGVTASSDGYTVTTYDLTEIA